MSKRRCSNLRMFTGITRNDFDPDIMLDFAKGRLQEVVILGYDENGDFFFSSSQADGADILWLLELARLKLMEMTEKITEGKIDL